MNWIQIDNRRVTCDVCDSTLTKEEINTFGVCCTKCATIHCSCGAVFTCDKLVCARIEYDESAYEWEPHYGYDGGACYEVMACPVCGKEM